jgi:hypothetical protein
MAGKKLDLSSLADTNLDDILGATPGAPAKTTSSLDIMRNLAGRDKPVAEEPKAEEAAPAMDPKVGEALRPVRDASSGYATYDKEGGLIAATPGVDIRSMGKPDLPQTTIPKDADEGTFESVDDYQGVNLTNQKAGPRQISGDYSHFADMQGVLNHLSNKLEKLRRIPGLIKADAVKGTDNDLALAFAHLKDATTSHIDGELGSAVGGGGAPKRYSGERSAVGTSLPSLESTTGNMRTDSIASGRQRDGEVSRLVRQPEFAGLTSEGTYDGSTGHLARVAALVTHIHGTLRNMYGDSRLAETANMLGAKMPKWSETMPEVKGSPSPEEHAAKIADSYTKRYTDAQSTGLSVHVSQEDPDIDLGRVSDMFNQSQKARKSLDDAHYQQWQIHRGIIKSAYATALRAEMRGRTIGANIMAKAAGKQFNPSMVDTREIPSLQTFAGAHGFDYDNYVRPPAERYTGTGTTDPSNPLYLKAPVARRNRAGKVIKDKAGNIVQAVRNGKKLVKPVRNPLYNPGELNEQGLPQKKFDAWEVPKTFKSLQQVAQDAKEALAQRTSANEQRITDSIARSKDSRSGSFTGAAGAASGAMAEIVSREELERRATAGEIRPQGSDIQEVATTALRFAGGVGTDEKAEVKPQERPIEEYAKDMKAAGVSSKAAKEVTPEEAEAAPRTVAITEPKPTNVFNDRRKGRGK